MVELNELKPLSFNLHLAASQLLEDNELLCQLAYLILGRFQGVTNVNYEAVLNIGFLQSLHGSVYIVHWNNLNICSYVVFPRKINHFLCLLHPSCTASSYYLPPCHSISC